MVEDHKHGSAEEYWESTNLERLAATAREHAKECHEGDSESLAACAAKVVRANVCFCIMNEKSIIDALISEVARIASHA